MGYTSIRSTTCGRAIRQRNQPTMKISNATSGPIAAAAREPGAP